MGNVNAQRMPKNDSEAQNKQSAPCTPAQSRDVVPQTAERYQASANENETDKKIDAKHSRQCGRTHIDHSQDSLDFTHCVPQDGPMIGFSEHHHTPAAPAPSSLVPQFPSQLPQHGTINDDVATDDQCAFIEHSQHQDDWLVFSQLRILVSQCSGFSGLNLNAPQ